MATAMVAMATAFLMVTAMEIVMEAVRAMVTMVTPTMAVVLIATAFAAARAADDSNGGAQKTISNVRQRRIERQRC